MDHTQLYPSGEQAAGQPSRSLPDPIRQAQAWQQAIVVIRHVGPAAVDSARKRIGLPHRHHKTAL
jgi:hypothetical protein